MVARIIASTIAQHVELAPSDLNLIKCLAYERRYYPAKQVLVRRGLPSNHLHILLAGWVVRQVYSRAGQPLVVGLLCPGDFLNINELVLATSDYEILALADVETLSVPLEDMALLTAQSSPIAKGILGESIAEARRVRRWMLNIGREDASTRVAHVICEFEVRLRNAGIQDKSGRLPVTQAQIADCTGLTAVHVNRIFRRFLHDGLVERIGRHFFIKDLNALCRSANFDPDALHY